jgi:hypothetical protein
MQVEPMPFIAPRIDETYREYADALLRHHNLISSSKDGGDEEQRIEDLLDRLWQRLDDSQRQSLRGMSSDLNSIKRGGEGPPKGRIKADVSASELQELQAAQKAENWHAILHHLRICAPAVPQDILARNRATCYDMIDLLQISLAFVDLAVELSRSISETRQFDKVVQ